MNPFRLLLGGLALSLSALSQPVKTPDQVYGPLLGDVQMSKVFPDTKTFVDCVPRRDPESIVADYYRLKNDPSAKFNLADFVHDNFDPPLAQEISYVTKETDVRKHIQNLWVVLKRPPDAKVKGSSLLPLPFPYVVPGGRFREIYYWDSYFTMLGLKESGDTATVENMVRNFDYLIQTYGHIPNGNRSYYITRSQPPFFAAMVILLAEMKGNSVYKEFLPALKKEYAYWMDGASTLKEGQSFRRVVKLDDGTILNRYYDDATTPRPEGYVLDAETAQQASRDKETMYRELRAGAESGIDFSNRWMADGKNMTSIQTLEIIAVDLNALLYNLEVTIAKGSLLAKDKTTADDFTAKAAGRKRAIDKYCWSNALKYYTDYNFTTHEATNTITLAGWYPFCFFPGDLREKAKQAAGVLKAHLLKTGGVVTTEFDTGQQWDAPNGWAPLHWMTIWGLERGGQNELAADIARRWIKLNTDVFKRTGKLSEKYNVVDPRAEAGGGEYAGQDGFGWTNGVLLALIQKYGPAD